MMDSFPVLTPITAQRATSDVQGVLGEKVRPRTSTRIALD